MSFDQNKLRTVHLVPLTAYSQTGEIDCELQSQQSEKMYAAGLRSFLPAAGTSEFHSLTVDEIVRIVQATIDAVGDDACVFAPVGLQINNAIQIAERCLAAGATGIMFMPFAHPYLSDSGARDYYLSVIERVPCPTLIYKKSPLPSNELLLELAAHPQVVGVKYAWNHMHEFRSTVLADTNNIEWVCGSAERFAPYYFLAGSNGYTTGAGNICPKLTLAMHAALTSGDFNTGMALQQKILPIEDYRAREGDSFNISMLKHALKKVGLDFGPPRPPQRQLSKPQAEEIDALIERTLAAESEL